MKLQEMHIIFLIKLFIGQELKLILSTVLNHLMKMADFKVNGAFLRMFLGMSNYVAILYCFSSGDTTLSIE